VLREKKNLPRTTRCSNIALYSRVSIYVCVCVCVLFRFVHQISSNVQIRLLELNYLNTTGGSDSNIFKQFEECLKTKSIEYSDFKYYRHGIRRGICSVW